MLQVLNFKENKEEKDGDYKAKKIKVGHAYWKVSEGINRKCKVKNDADKTFK